MANDYFVCLENRLGEAHWTRFDSKDAFDEWYVRGRMEDETPIKVEYPRVPYQGADERACSEIAAVRNERLKDNPSAYVLMRLKAGTGDWSGVDRVYHRFFSD